MAGPTEIVIIPPMLAEEIEEMKRAMRMAMDAPSRLVSKVTPWWNRSKPDLIVIVGEPIEEEKK